MIPSSNSRHRRGFTLVETVFAIGVLAVLLTGFILVFTPAAEGIKKSINIQLADRLASAVEQELVTLRGNNESTTFKTGFNKSYDWIPKSNEAANALFVYQYRGEIGGSPRSDGTPKPVVSVKDKSPGKDYTVISMVRRRSDSEFINDLKAVEGAVYLVRCSQLIFSSGQLIPSTDPLKIKDPKTGTPSPDADAYPEAVIAFSVDFHMMPNKAESYFTGTTFTNKFANLKNPVFTRNLAVRR